MTSVARRREQDDSGEYSDASQENGQNNSANDAPAPESDYDSRGSESDLSEKDQDGQEAEKRVDDDEDRSNPQYIPKRGTFYEHDDRTAASGEEPANPTASEAAVEKKESGPGAPPERRRPPRPSDTTNKWSHDKYHENEQMPKSRDELVSIYGYDIRNEDAPPHARRNRRYGRGPNKYTRTWEDEEAYKRQATAATPNRKPPNLEDFPELEAAGKRSNKKRPPRPRSKSQPNSEHSLENGTTELKRNASIKSPRSRDPVRKNPERIERTVVNKAAAPVGKQPERPDRMPAIERLTITANVNASNGAAPQRKVNATVAQQRPVPTAQGKKPAPQPPAPQQNSSQPPAPSVKAQAPAPPQQPPTTQASAPTAEARGSKRYSSLRQRPLAEPYSPQQAQQQQQQPQQQQQQHRYAEFPSNQQPAPAPAHQGSPAPPQQQQIMHQQVHRTPAVTQPQHGPSPPHQTIAQPHNQQQVRLGMMEQQLVQHPHHQIHNMPPHTMVSAAQLPPAQGYPPSGMMPAQYMQQGANNGVYAGAPMFAQPPAYPHQLYQHQYINTPQAFQNPGATQAGGVTYYTHGEPEPPAVPLPRTQRRPTAAIPIVRPEQPERPPNPTEKDIDRIVENMFVRKPWPATTSADSKEKSQTESRDSQEPASKDSSQPNSLTSSSISNESRPSAERTEPKEQPKEEPKAEEPTRSSEEKEVKPEAEVAESISQDA